jgi:small nuclear ribonucleoprotein F
MTHYTNYADLRPSVLAWQLDSAEEYIDGALAGNLGEILIRCNNVLYVRGVEDGSAMKE